MTIPCADCKVEVHVPSDAKPDSEFRVCTNCFGRRATNTGFPSDAAGRIVMYAEGKLIRWSTPVEEGA